MVVKNIFLSALFCSFYVAYADISPASLITKCRGTDTECITKSSQAVLPKFVNGIPEYKVDPLEPVVFKFIDASSPHLTLLLDDLKVEGFNGCKLNKVERDLSASKINLNLSCDFRLNGKYKMDGSILVLKIQGDGDVHAIIGNINVLVSLDLDEYVGKDGLKYWRITGYNFTFKVLGKSKLDFQNLFQNNKVLGDAARQLFDTNPNEVAEEIGGPIIDTSIKTVIKGINNMFKRIPAKDLAIP